MTVSGAGGGVLPFGGMSTWGCTRSWTQRQTPHPVNRITDRCKNITFATTVADGRNITYIEAQWWIQDFPWGGGANSQSRCANLLFCKLFAENCMKNGRIWTPRVCVSLAPPWSIGLLARAMATSFDLKVTWLGILLDWIGHRKSKTHFGKKKKIEIEIFQNINQWSYS